MAKQMVMLIIKNKPTMQHQLKNSNKIINHQKKIIKRTKQIIIKNKNKTTRFYDQQ